MAKTKDNLSGLFQGTTAPYNASAPNYGAMPQQVNMPAFMPGFQDAIAQQMSQGYGASPQSYTDAMNQYYKPVSMTQLSEPLTQSMRAWGLKPNGQPGGVEGTISGGYQQYGMSTGSPWLDAMFGLQATAGTPAAPAPAPASPLDDPKKKRQQQAPVPAPMPVNQQMTPYQMRAAGGFL